MNDVGQVTLNCDCSINNVPAEAIDLISTTGTYGGTFYFSQVASAQTGGILTTVVGTSQDHGVTIDFITDGVHYGLPAMDSKAFVGETWAYTVESSTITAINDNQDYAGPYVLIKNVNTDSYNGELNASWRFGQGVGITALAYNGQTAVLTSFTVDALNSTSIRQSGSKTVHMAGATTAKRAFDLLKALL
jgi:hypothetical protein